MLPFLHRSLSRQVLTEFGFSPQAVDIVGTTSQWTDWYRWSDPIANASTPHDQQTGEVGDAKAAALACSTLLKSYLGRICQAGTNERLVWLGFALHLVQDLAVHQGRTNIEHGHQVIAFWQNPDWSPSGYARATGYSRKLLARLRELMESAEFSKLQQSSGCKIPDRVEAERILGPKDISLASMLDFFRDSYRFLFTKSGRMRVRWNTDDILQHGLES